MYTYTEPSRVMVSKVSSSKFTRPAANTQVESDSDIIRPRLADSLKPVAT